MIDKRTRQYKQSHTTWCAILALALLAGGIFISSVFVAPRKSQPTQQIEVFTPKVSRDLTKEELDSLNCEINKSLCPVATPKPRSFFNSIWTKESSKGQNKTPNALHMYCRNIGKWNEIGYNPQTKYCFANKAEAIDFVDGYVVRNCTGKTQAQCECFWNLGKASKTCAYSEGYLSLAN